MTTRIATRKGIASLKTMSVEQLESELSSAIVCAKKLVFIKESSQALEYYKWATYIQKELDKRN